MSQYNPQKAENTSQQPVALKLFAALDQRLEGDRGVPGFVGKLGLAVISPAGQRWWWVSAFSKVKVDTDTLMTTPDSVDAVMFMSEEHAECLLCGTKPGAGAQVHGDIALMRRFAERYLKHTNFLSVRAQG